MKVPQLRDQLVLNFFILCALAVLGFAGLFLLNEKRSSAENLFRILDETHVNSMKAFKLQSDFLFIETKNPEFYRTRRSSIKDEFDRLIKLVETRLLRLKYNKLVQNKTLSVYNFTLLQLHRSYVVNFSRIVNLYRKKGFKDYGKEGEMRRYAHLLMNERVNQSFDYNVLLLRRHEKDFLIRKEIKYIHEFDKLMAHLLDETGNWNSLTRSAHPKENEWLIRYEKSFAELVDLEMKIGLSPSEGYLARLSNNFNMIQTYYTIYEQNLLSIKRDYENLFTAIICFYCFFLLFVLILVGRVFIIRITRGVELVQTSMQQYVENNFSRSPEIKKLPDNREFRSILVSFMKMAREIDAYINYFKQKVEERTREIRIQKEEIEIQKTMILKQNSLLNVQKLELEISKAQLFDQNKNLLDSIRYARRLQDALLLPHSELQKYFEESFILYLPKDIVSGDFYWIDKVKVALPIYVEQYSVGDIEEEPADSVEAILVAAADCTGHGVPGAFMSILGVEAIRRSVHESGIHQPAKLLDSINREMRKSLHQESSESGIVKDGMDIGVFMYIPALNKLIFSGANMQLLRVNGSGITRFRGNKLPIGIYDDFYKGNIFNEHCIELLPGDCIYLHSDGFTDQFGGPKNKKYKQKQFIEFLIDIYTESLPLQSELLRKSFQNWRGANEQIDDVMVLGFRFGNEN